MRGHLSRLVSAQVHCPVGLWGWPVRLWSVGHLLREHGEAGQRVCSRRGSGVEGESRVGHAHPRVMIRVEVGSVRALALPLVAVGVVHVVGDLQQVQETDGGCGGRRGGRGGVSSAANGH